MTDLDTARTGREAAESQSNPVRGDIPWPGTTKGAPEPELEDARPERERKWKSGWAPWPLALC